MLLSTKNFGEIEINEKGVVTFNDGLPGFEVLEKFIVIRNEVEETPFCWLQSIENSNLAFVLINPTDFKKDYTFTIDDSIINSLEIEAAEDVSVYAVVVVPEDVSKISANLKAPILINTKNNRAKQVILDTNEYNVRHYILEELQK